MRFTLKRTFFKLGLIALVWFTVLYLTLTYPTTKPLNTSDNVNNQIIKLEKGISEQFKLNNDIISEAQHFLETKKKAEQQNLGDLQDVKIPVLVFACNRITITRCLDRLLKYRPDPDKFPIIVSEVMIDKLNI